MRVHVAGLAAVLLLASCSENKEPSAVETGKSPKFILAASPVKDRYIVVLREEAASAASVDDVSKDLAKKHGASVRRTFKHALRGFSADMPKGQAMALSEDPRVRWVEEDGVVTIVEAQENPTWGLDRIDQRALPLDARYVFHSTGAGVSAFVIDTGIRVTHQEFGGRASLAFDSVGDGGNGNDCHGHGTHVAGTIGGATYGVAKDVKLFAVRVLDCGGSGSYEGVVAGVDWVTANHVGPSVANMSLGGGPSASLDLAVQNSIASGVIYAIAGGNDSGDACNKSPARVPEAITVAASDSSDAAAYFTNQGTCIDVWGPGVNVTSAWNTSDTATNTISGTSMATPHVAGTVALLLQGAPTATPAMVTQALTANATPEVVTGVAYGTPNLLLFEEFISAGPPDFEPPAVALTAPASGAVLAGTVTVSADATDNVGVTQVRFLVDGVVIGAVAAPPYELPWDTTLGDNGTFTLTAKAYDAFGNVTASAPAAVVVNNPGFAEFEEKLGVPVCRSSDLSYCKSGTLLLGRGSAGPEAHAPNTIDGCPDGAGGAFHLDESVDALTVRTVDGSSLAEGKNVRVEAKVWAYSSFASDRLDLFRAASANAPEWVYLGTLQPTGAGKQTLQAVYTLPAGDLQAVRAVLRFNGAPGTCSAGLYDDHDDLAFSVGVGTPDATPPEVTVTAPADGASLSGAVEVQATVFDADFIAEVEFLANGVPFATDDAEPWSATFDPKVNGTYALTVRARDGSGNVGTSAPVTVTYADVTPPTVGLTAPAAGAQVRGDVLVSAAATDDVAVERVEFFVDGTPLDVDLAAPFEVVWPTGAAAEGAHTLLATAYDRSGNAGTTEARSVVVDRTPPAVAISSPAGGSTVAGNVPVTLSATDANPIVRVELWVNGALYAADASAPWSITWNTGTLTGSATLVAKAYDAAGNVAVSAPVSVTVADVVAPAVSIASPANDAWVRGPVAISASVSDASGVTRVDFYVDGVYLATDTASPFQATWVSTAAPEGPHTVAAKAYDAARNEGASAPVTVKVDNTLPVVAITAPAAGPVAAGNVTVTAAVTDANPVRAELYVNGTLKVTDTAAPWSLVWATGTFLGDATLVVKAYDAAGNSASSPPVAVVVVDSVPPTVSLSAPSNGAFVRGVVTVSASASDASGIARVEFSVDGTLASTDTASPWTFAWDTAALSGAHTLAATAFDVAGNSASATVSVTVDNAPPVVAITSPAAGTVAPGTIPVTVSLGEDNPTRVELYVNGAYKTASSTAPWTTSWITGTLLGDASLTVKAYDRAGNVTTSAPVAVTVVDTTPPTVSLYAPSNGSFVRGNVTISASVSDAGGLARVEFAVDGTPLVTRTAAPWSTPWDTAGVAAGIHTVSATAFDASGNSATSTVSVTVDNAAPVVAITSPAPGTVAPGTIPVTVSLTEDNPTRVELYVNGVYKAASYAAPWTISWTTGALLGEATLTVKAYDRAGSVTTSAPVAVGIVDTAAPTVSLSSPSNGSFVRGVVTVNASASDPGGLARVDFSVDGTLLASDATSPFTTPWDTAAVAAGAHTVSATAVDASGNSATSTVSVTVDNAAPVVAITSPAPGTVAPATIPVTVSLTEDNPTRVELYVNGTYKGASYAAPWTVSWTTGTLLGEAALTVKAYDRAGSVTTSAPVAVTIVDTAPPTVSLYAPANAAFVRGAVTLSASASDAGGLARVDFSVDGALLASDTAYPWTATWDTAGLTGVHALSATAFDASGNSATSTVSVTVDNAAPAVSVTSPATGAAVAAGSVPVTVALVDDSPLRVELYVNGVYKAASYGTPWTLNWSTGTFLGTARLEVKAYDRAGAATTSAPVDVTVEDRTAPSASFGAPYNGAYVRGAVAVTVSASDNIGVTRVELLDGGTPFATLTAAPWTATWDASALSGSHTLTANVSDAAGNLRTVAISVTVDNGAPTATLTAPADGATVAGTITLSATAADGVAVARVEFLVNGTLLASDAYAPYAVSWATTGAANGSYAIVARAVDRAGNATESPAATVTVANP